MSPAAGLTDPRHGWSGWRLSEQADSARGSRDAAEAAGPEREDAGAAARPPPSKPRDPAAPSPAGQTSSGTPGLQELRLTAGSFLLGKVLVEKGHDEGHVPPSPADLAQDDILTIPLTLLKAPGRTYYVRGHLEACYVSF